MTFLKMPNILIGSYMRGEKMSIFSSSAERKTLSFLKVQSVQNLLLNSFPVNFKKIKTVLQLGAMVELVQNKEMETS